MYQYDLEEQAQDMAMEKSYNVVVCRAIHFDDGQSFDDAVLALNAHIEELLDPTVTALKL